MFIRGTVIALIFIVLISGCASFKYLDGSSEKELESYNNESPEKAKELAAEVDELKGRLEDSERQVSALEEQVALLNMQANEAPALREENERLASDNRDLRNELTAAMDKPADETADEEDAATGEATEAVAETKPVEQNKGAFLEKKEATWLPKIKVLTGTGNLSSADKMSKNLFSMGYEVYRIDKASKKFSVNTVFYAEGFMNDAVIITNSLGGKAVYKPLTWHSAFDIIVVTGLKR